ncbi:MAG: sigma-70 family RNA polymerase sigma factor [Gloeomargarita sp. SKYBB_i_bin120]|nr:sigma-70 family RNA polymerase sigma factor [Gloeomargarita sp. SKYG98]MCS7292171.1 sigma-70 family RNA polymerase sigma factor [Gloeomargarita sp. SKYB120]MDW8177732.1 sigma-70 family RNA polymerase sigma factor [Gloeomargarita sp. SKYBB_i_bin120]
MVTAVASNPPIAQTERSEPNDWALVQQCQQGDPEGFRWLYRRFQARVRGTLYRLCGGDALDDLTQEVFMRVWRGLPRLRQAAMFNTWLYRITLNVAQDYRRQCAHQRTQLQTLTQVAPDRIPAPDLLDLHYEELVRQGLAALSFDQRTVLVLHDLEALSQKEISEILQIPVGTVKSRLFHARAALRRYLETQGVSL